MGILTEEEGGRGRLRSSIIVAYFLLGGLSVFIYYYSRGRCMVVGVSSIGNNDNDGLGLGYN